MIMGITFLHSDRPSSRNQRYSPYSRSDPSGYRQCHRDHTTGFALADVIKGVSMFQSKSIDVPVLGIIENMSWFTPAELPKNKYYIFGKDGGKNLAEKMGIPLLGQIPIVMSIREGGDNGIPVAWTDDATLGNAFSELAANVIQQLNDRNENLKPTERVHVKKR